MHAGGEHDRARREHRAVVELDARHAVAVGEHARHAAAADLDGLAAAPPTSRRGSIEWSPATSSASRTVGASAGSSRRAWLGRSRATSRPSELAEGDQPLERLGLVGVARHDERAGAAQARVAAGRPRRARRRRPRTSPALRSPSSSSARSPNSASATGASMPAATCQAPGSPASSTTARQPAPRGAPGAREADRPAADDGHVWVTALLPLVAFPPYAGTTRIRFDGRRPGAALSARSRAPVMDVPILECPRSMTPRERIAGARLYLVCDARPREFLAAAIRGGVDVIQLRDKALDDDGLVTAAREFRAAADAHGALFVLNDRPDLVDGVRRRRRPRRPGRRRAGRRPRGRRPGPRSSGAPRTRPSRPTPRRPTPTSTTSPSARCTPRRPSPGRPAAGLDYVAYAAGHARKPWFAIGGLDAGNVAEVAARGATRVVVVRAIADADDPEAAARALRAALEEARGQAKP